MRLFAIVVASFVSFLSVGVAHAAVYSFTASLNGANERMAPIRANLAIDTATGIRSFVVGTGNSSQRPFFTVKPSSQARSTGVQGVLRLTLRAGDYDWTFVPIAGQTYSDSGTAPCH